MDEKNKQADGVKTAGANLREEIERIVRGDDSDASLILGPHWIERDGKRALVVRAFRPGATEANLLWSGISEPQAMTQIHRDGAFEAIASPSAGILREGEAPAPNAYRLRFRFADGNTWEDYDPYAFPPLLT